MGGSKYNVTGPELDCIVFVTSPGMIIVDFRHDANMAVSS